MQKYQYSSNPTVTACGAMFYGCCIRQLMPGKVSVRQDGEKERNISSVTKGILRLKNKPTKKFETGIHKFLEKVYATNKIPRQQCSAV